MTRANSRHKTADLTIIGAGIVGTSIAVSAAQNGYRVTVIDSNPTPGFGSTSASAGIIRVHAADEASSVLSAESIAAWKHWRDFLEIPEDEPAAEFVQCGTYILDDGNGTIDRFASVLRNNSISFSELNHAELQEALPWADLDRFGPPALPDQEEFWKEPEGVIERALYTPESGYVADPALAAQNLANQATRLGARFLLGKTVVSLSEMKNGRWTVELHDGELIETDIIVNAAGPGSMHLNQILGVGEDFAVKQRLIRQELHHVRAAEPLTNPAHVVDGDLGINFRPEGDDGFMVGASGDPVDGEELIEDPKKFRQDATRDGWFRQAGRAARRIPSLQLTAIPNGLAGLYDVTDDWLPIFDRTNKDGIFVAIGTSGNQFKTAPVVGDFMVRLIDANMNGRNTDTDPLTITFPRTELSVTTSVFSRLREPNQGGIRG